MAENTSQEKEVHKYTRVSEKVLFVRNLPYRLSDEEFEQAFSEIGPLKRAFVAREKGKTSLVVMYAHVVVVGHMRFSLYLCIVT